MPACCCLRSEACFKGKHTGQSLRVQFFQWEIICLEEEQCGTPQDFPAWHVVMWLNTCFIVRQWGSEHCLTSPLDWFSLLWHLWAWSRRTSCCWISFRFSGSAVGAGAPTDDGVTLTAPGEFCWTVLVTGRLDNILCGTVCWNIVLYYQYDLSILSHLI